MFLICILLFYTVVKSPAFHLCDSVWKVDGICVDSYVNMSRFVIVKTAVRLNDYLLFLGSVRS